MVAFHLNSLLSHSERLARQHGESRLGLVFSAVSAVSLGIMSTKMVIDMIHDRHRDREHGNGHHPRVHGRHTTSPDR